MAEFSWKRTGRRAGYLVLFAGFLSANHDVVASSAVADGAEVNAAAGGADLTHAHAEARIHLDRFLDRVMQENGTARGDAAIKVAVLTASGLEEFWVTPIARYGERLSGRPTSANRAIAAKAGTTIEFSPHQVRDWSYTGTNRRLYGNFTTRALLQHLDQNRATEVIALLSADPVPEAW